MKLHLPSILRSTLLTALTTACALASARADESTARDLIWASGLYSTLAVGYTWSTDTSLTNWKVKDGGDTRTYFSNGDNVTFSAHQETSPKTVNIANASDIQAGIIHINGNYKFIPDTSSTISGTFDMASGTTLYKTGTGTLTLNVGANSVLKDLQVLEGKLELAVSSGENLSAGSVNIRSSGSNDTVGGTLAISEQHTSGGTKDSTTSTTFSSASITLTSTNGSTTAVTFTGLDDTGVLCSSGTSLTAKQISSMTGGLISGGSISNANVSLADSRILELNNTGISGTFTMASGSTIKNTGSGKVTLTIDHGQYDSNTKVNSLNKLSNTGGGTLDVLVTGTGVSAELRTEDISISTLAVADGATLALTKAITYANAAIGAIEIRDGGALSLAARDVILRATSFTIEGGGVFSSASKWAIGSSDGPTRDGAITIKANNGKNAVFKQANSYSDTTHIKANITGDGTLELQSTTDAKGSTALNGNITDGGSGQKLALKVSSGNVMIEAADDTDPVNTYSGGTTVAGGTLTVSVDDGLGEGGVTVNGGTLKVSGTHTLANTISLGTAVTLSATDASVGATYTGTTMTASSLNGSVTGASMTLSQNFSLQGSLTNSKITIAEGLTMDGSNMVSGLDLVGTKISSASAVNFGNISLDAASSLTATSTGSILLDGANTLVFAVAEQPSSLEVGEDGLVYTSTQLSGVQMAQGATLTFSTTQVLAGETTFAFSGLTADESNFRLGSGFDGYSITSVSYSDAITSVTVSSPASIPEPATATLSLLALAGLAARRRRK